MMGFSVVFSIDASEKQTRILQLRHEFSWMRILAGLMDRKDHCLKVQAHILVSADLA